MRSTVTISLVNEAKGGPFVFWNDIPAACKHAAELGFDAVEIFPPQAWGFDVQLLNSSLKEHKLSVAAMGTGAGWVKHKLLLTSPNPAIREEAQNFVAAMIDCAAEHNAPAIIGSMQGKVEPGGDRDRVMALFREAVDELAPLAEKKNQVLLIEPLNRYETNLLNTVQQGLEFLSSLKSQNVRLLLDAFHMNIEEQNIPQVIRLAGPAVGHFHFADSNRRAVGFGHTEFRDIIQALRDINYQGYLSAEILPWPSSEAAAAQTIEAFKALAK
jgi:sugar phosphate isomerase/epimerase